MNEVIPPAFFACVIAVQKRSVVVSTSVGYCWSNVILLLDSGGVILFYAERKNTGGFVFRRVGTLVRLLLRGKIGRTER